MLLPLRESNQITAWRPILLAIILVLLSSSACERRTEARLEGGNPPIFSISAGTGRVWVISIGEYQMNKTSNAARGKDEIWRVEPKRDKSGELLGKQASEIGKVTYGVVPEGYVQITPTNDSPPPLAPGKYYSYEFKAEKGMAASGDFAILDGSAVRVKINHLCMADDGKEKIEVPCTESANQYSLSAA
jgi:hypothetical protein